MSEQVEQQVEEEESASPQPTTEPVTDDVTKNVVESPKSEPKPQLSVLDVEEQKADDIDIVTNNAENGSAIQNVPPVLEEEQKTQQEEATEIPSTPTLLDPEEEPEETQNNEDEIEAIAFTVKTPSGKVYSLHKDPSTLLLEVKEQLGKLSDPPMEVHHIKLIFKGKPLNDNNRTLLEVGVMKDSKLFMVKQLYGGSNEKDAATPMFHRGNRNERNFITIRIPQSAKPGNRLVIHPPGRQRMVVYVPEGMGPGDELRVQLPGTESNANPLVPNPMQQQNQNRNSGRPNRPDQMTTPNFQASTLLKVLCPDGARAGQEVLINVAHFGAVKVAASQAVRPGGTLYFRFPPL